MSTPCYILTIFGADQLGIVAKISQSVFRLGANLNETSMSRLGNFFTIMAFIEFAGDEQLLVEDIRTVAASMNLQFHIDKVAQHDHQQLEPDVRITFYDNDKIGLVAKVTAELERCKVNILNLQTDVSHSETNPLFIMTIEGKTTDGIERLQEATSQLKAQGIEIHVESTTTLIA